MKKRLFLYSFCLHFIPVLAQKTFLLTGTYTSGKSEGIYVHQFNPVTLENQLVSVTKIANPSFLAVSKNQQFVYAVSETADTAGNYVGGKINAFSFDALKGLLTPINAQQSGGKNPCYVALDQSNRWLFAGNYSSGSIGLIPVQKDGSLLPLKRVITHTGSGPNISRQTAPHVHSTLVAPDNKNLYVPDLGIDKIMVYQFKAGKGKLKYKSAAVSIPGSGPRHMDIHPNYSFAYLMEEMTGTVTAYRIKKNKLVFIQRIPALQADFKGLIGSADIHVSPNGKFLYCSNRGESNTISIFSIDQLSGNLTFVKEQSVLGEKPRNFNFDPTGTLLLVANQNSGSIVIFKMDAETGLLTDTGKRIEVPNPVCLKWITL